MNRMKKNLHFQSWLALAVALPAIVVLSGCIALVAGAAAGVAGVSYVGNELRTTVDASFDRVWTAARGAVTDLQLSRAGEERDAVFGRLKAVNAKGQPVEIEIFRKGDRLTEIRIRVGTFSTSENRSFESLIYEKMRARF
jgi:hypothetical protein